MYSILSVIYGIPVDEPLQEVIEEYFESNGLSEDDYEDYGYEQLYHGGLDETPAYIGVILKNIDLLEASHSLEEFTDVKVEQSTKDEVEEFINKFPEEIKEQFKEVGLYIMHSSS